VRPIKFIFNERKAVQVAARLITHSGGEMNYMALMKLLYLADREALLKFGRPITGDRIVAMKNGLVLSRIFDLISQTKQAGPKSEWHTFIPRPGPYVYTVRFGGVAGVSELSEAELALVDEVYSRFRGMNEWDLVNYTHSLPEWRNPNNSSVPIPFEEILKAEKKSANDIQAIAESAEADLLLDAELSKHR
jgi:uncharacterized phage-associated protein